MKHPVRYAALILLALGGVGLVLRRLLYSLALDEKHLLPLNHPLETLLWVLTAAAAAAVLAVSFRTDKNLALRTGRGLEQAVGHLMMGLGMVLAVNAGQAAQALELLHPAGEAAWQVGEVVAGDAGVELV